MATPPLRQGASRIHVPEFRQIRVAEHADVVPLPDDAAPAALPAAAEHHCPGETARVWQPELVEGGGDGGPGGPAVHGGAERTGTPAAFRSARGVATGASSGSESRSRSGPWAAGSAARRGWGIAPRPECSHVYRSQDGRCSSASHHNSRPRCGKWPELRTAVPRTARAGWPPRYLAPHPSCTTPSPPHHLATPPPHHLTAPWIPARRPAIRRVRRPVGQPVPRGRGGPATRRCRRGPCWGRRSAGRWHRR